MNLVVMKQESVPQSGVILRHRSSLVLTWLLCAMMVASAHSQQATPESAPPVPAPSVPAPSAPVGVTAAPQDQPVEVVAGEQRTLASGLVLRMKGKSTWEDGFTTMTRAFATLKEEARRATLAVSGNPRLYFIESDDLTFTYEAYLPLDGGSGSSSFAPGVEIAQSPAARVILFPYDGSYDEIDSAYEAIAAWLDDKGLVSTGSFIEEYLAIPPRADDPGLRVTIHVFLK